MASASSMRWVADGLLLATGLIHIVYVPIAVPLFGHPPEVYSFAPAYYLMGAIYLVGVVALAANIRPRLFQKLALIYTVVLVLLYAAIGTRDWIGYLDKTIAVILMIVLVAVIRQKAVGTAAHQPTG